MARRVSTDDDPSHHIHNLQNALAVDDDVAVAEIREIPMIIVKDVFYASFIDQHGAEHPGKIDGEVGVDIPTITPLAKMVP